VCFCLTSEVQDPASPAGVLNRGRIGREAGHFVPMLRLPELVIVGLDNGLLWILDGEPVWMGHGTHKPCVVCRLRIDGQQIQYDVPGPRGALRLI
jgi:hypothetical protein